VASRHIEAVSRRGDRFGGGTDAFTIEDVRALVKALAGTDVTTVRWHRSGQRMVIGRGAHVARDGARATPALALAAPPVLVPVAVEPPRAPETEAPAAPPPLGRAPERETKPGLLVTTPFVGTFYRAPSPEAAPFVEVGARVKKGQVLCIVEAMKLMNEIEAETSGRIAEVLVENAAPVESGQALFRIEPG
jgi:acetyl-CoA carboxylase biotin carboxyl carrier protein